MSLKTQLLCEFRLFYLNEPSWILVIQRNLQTVDAFYASMQIRCTAHNQPIAGFTEYKKQYHKGPTFSFVVYCCTQRQSEKVNIRNACVLPVRAKCGRFCVLMNGRVFGHSRLSVFWTAATVRPPYWQNGGSSPPDLTVTDRLLVPANAKAGSAARSPQTSRFRAEGIIGHVRLLLPQPSLAVCVRRRCPNRGVATGNLFPMRHRTNHHN